MSAHQIPLSTGHCADYMGRSAEYIRQAIKSRELEASYIKNAGRLLGRYCITPQAFYAFLKKVGWRHLPKV